MNAIVAVDENWGIGKNNELLCHLPGDLKYYKETTLGKCVIMGRKTLESLPGSKPLPGRDHIILSKDSSFSVEPRKGHACHVVNSREEAIKLAAEYEAKEGSEGVFVCGGSAVYRLFLEDCRSFYVTKIHRSFDADRFFPNLDEMGLEITWESEIQIDEATGIEYTFMKYERV